MFTGEFIRQSAVKNQGYTLYFCIKQNNGLSTGAPSTGLTFSGGSTILQISQDGGAFATLTNVPSELGQGWYSLVLTSTEMNADVILLTLRSSTTNNNTPNYIKIETTPQELTAAPAITDNFTKKVLAVWQYLVLKRTVTATAEVLKKSDGSTTLATSVLSDNGTTFTKGALS